MLALGPHGRGVVLQALLVNSYPGLVDEAIENGPDEMSDAELADAARPVLDAAYQAELSQIKALYEVEQGTAGRHPTAVCAPVDDAT